MKKTILSLSKLLSVNNLKEVSLSKVFLGCIFLMFTLISHTSLAQVSGTVFRDFNANGVKDVSANYNDAGQGGITVKAYNTAGVEVGSTTSAANGTYSFTGLTLPLRIEFTTTLTGDFPGASGSGSASSVQFYTAASTTANYGINYPAQYSQANPDFVTSCYVNGRPPIEPTTKVIVKYPYTGTGVATANTYLADAEQIGSTWGIAYNKSNKLIYTSAFVKRHVSMVDNDANGTEDIGAIYTLTSTGSPTLWLDFATLANVGLSLMPTIATRGLPLSQYDPSNDAAVFDVVGKIGLGDLDISDDNNQLFVVNLFDQKIYTIDIATKTLVGTGIALPSACTGGVARPFGLKFHRGKLYAGAICDATTSNSATDLRANLYRLDGASFTNILTFPLTYTKGYTDKDVFPGTNLYGTLWQPWRSSFYPVPAASAAGVYIYPQPIFADIEFDNNEEVIMSFNDRTGHQTGYRNYGTNPADPITQYSGFNSGDILRAALVSGSYVLESNASVDGVTTAGAGNSQGPGGGEFYFEDLHGDSFGDYHQETIMGGATMLHGSGQIAINVMNPLNSFSGGTARMNNTTGVVDADYEVYNASPVNLGKAAGLGDLELLSNLAPIEIGNRVWLDTDNDGIQDAGEAGIAGITVTLCLASAPTVAVATATTDANGNYYFSSATGTSTASFIYGVNLLNTTAYILKFPLTSGANALSIKPNLGSNDLIDTDADAIGKIAFTTGGVGENNHSFDAGYATCISPTATASATQPLCTGTNAPNNGGITIAAFAAGQRYQYTSGGTFTGTATPATITPIPSLGVITSTLANTSGSYTVRIYDATDDACFVDRVVNITAVTCTITCTAPTAGTPVVTQATCNNAGTAANNDASILILGITNATVYAYTTDGSTPAFAGATTVSGSIINLTGLSNPVSATTYKFRIFNGSATCYTDVTATLNPKTCSPTCTPPNAGADMTICLPKTSLNLSDAITGTEWVAVAGNPATVVINSTTGVITGMTVTGTYKFRLQKTGDATCSDEMQVVVTAGDAVIILCNDGSTSYTLLSQSGYSNVIWYNMAGVQVGTGTSLIVKSTTLGLEDGTEAYYYEGTNTIDGCAGELCCPVKFMTQSCCPFPNCKNVTVVKNIK